MAYELIQMHSKQGGEDFTHLEGMTGKTITSIIKAITDNLRHSNAHIIEQERIAETGRTLARTETHSFTFAEVEAKTEFTRSQIEAITRMIEKLAGWNGIDLVELDEQFNGAYDILEEALNND